MVSDRISSEYLLDLQKKEVNMTFFFFQYSKCKYIIQL